MKIAGTWTAFGSDDFAAAYALESLLYLCWLGWAMGCSHLGHASLVNECFAKFFVKFYFPISLFVMVSSLFTALLIVHISLKGTLINAYPRRHMSKLLITKMIMDGVTMLLLIISTWQSLSAVSSCLEDDRDSRKWMSWQWLSVKLMWCVMLPILLGTWHRIAVLRANEQSGIRLTNLEQDVSIKSEVAKNWHARFTSLGGDHASLTEVSNLFLNLFTDDIDLVTTDVLACLMLLGQEESLRRSNMVRRGSQSQDSAVSPPVWMNIPRARHYMRFALAAYGWPWYILPSKQLVRSLWRIYHISRVLARNRRLDNVVVNDPWLTNTAVICTVCNLQPADLIHVSYRNELFEVPFFVALDHVHKAVVVSVRGTLSLEDVITDMTAYASEELHLSDVDAVSVHAGMLHAARNIRQRLVGTDDADGQHTPGLLSLAYQRLAQSRGLAAATQEYQLVITGHSLGAGVAAVLALLMQDDSKYCELQCFAFSPPGGLVSLSGALYCEKFVISVFLGDDIIPRLSISSAFELKIRLLTTLLHCDLPKHAIIGGTFLRWISHVFALTLTLKFADWSRTSPSWQGSAAAKQAVLRYQNKIQATIDRVQLERSKQSDLYLPGCILHITETADQQCQCSSRASYSSHYYSCTEDEFHSIIVGTKIVAHHTPWLVLEALDSLVDSATG